MPELSVDRARRGVSGCAGAAGRVPAAARQPSADRATDEHARPPRRRA
ncbi:MAG: hypothetical protein MZW92_08435 [Comamonadaceae bacterium]|nr:hypothetical protein [Comamonadaceae bacterium]